MFSEIDFIIGVDQTGALKSGKRKEPKPLPICILKRTSKNKWELIAKDKNGKNLFLDHFRISCIGSVLKNEFNADLARSKVFMCIDTILGLPAEVSKSQASPLKEFRSLLSDLKANEGYGSTVAEDFFLKFLKRKKYSGINDQFPKRRVEEKLGANSLFRAKPYQRNIQTGSYRILKQLAEEKLGSFKILPFQDFTLNFGIPIICEGYPSFSWKILNKSTRASSDFSELKKKLGNNISNLDRLSNMSSDHKDAAFLTFQVVHELKKGNLQNLNASRDIEGGILGESY